MASDLGLHCLLKTLLHVSRKEWVKVRELSSWFSIAWLCITPPLPPPPPPPQTHTPQPSLLTDSTVGILCTFVCATSPNPSPTPHTALVPHVCSFYAPHTPPHFNSSYDFVSIFFELAIFSDILYLFEILYMCVCHDLRILHVISYLPSFTI